MTTGDCPPSFACGGQQVWETWWTVYHKDNLLYTLYAADQGAFAVDHRYSKKHNIMNNDISYTEVLGITMMLVQGSFVIK